MKRGNVVIICLILVSILSISVVSASLLTDIKDFFQNLFNIGEDRDLGGELAARKPSFCTDSDGGLSYSVYGTCTDSLGTVADSCVVGGIYDRQLAEGYCQGKTCITKYYNCGSEGKICSSGECITSCTDTCTSKGYQCGTWTICGVSTNCGSCPSGYYCNTTGKCVLNATCTAGWKCKDSANKAYQLSNCSWTNITNCLIGQTCQNGNCITSDLYSGLVSWWKMDEVVGNKLIDSQGLHNGTLMNDSHIENDIVRGKVLKTDGINDYVNIGAFDETENLNEFTVSFWAKAAVADDNTIRYIFDKSSNMFMYRSSLEYYSFNVYNDTSVVSSKTLLAPKDTNWHHIVAVYNKTNVFTYIDMNKSSLTQFSGDTRETTSNFTISMYASLGFNGSIDDFMFFKRALSAEEVYNLYISQSASCTNECDVSGGKVCVGNSSYKTCGNYDADSCLEWSSVTNCLAEEICENGNCKTSICTDTCASKGYQCGTWTICEVSTNCGSCSSGYTCDFTGKCVETIYKINQKNMNMYSDKEVFLISDKNWKDVLPLVPVAVWTNSSNGIEKYPFLVYYEENFTNKTLELNKDIFLYKTSISLSWNFKNNTFASGTLKSENFTIVFNLDDDMYDKIQRGSPEVLLYMNASMINSSLGWDEKLNYSIYFNGKQIFPFNYFSKLKTLYYFSITWTHPDKSYYKKGQNNLTFIRTGGNILFNNYTLFSTHFAEDYLDELCGRKYAFINIYDLCFQDVQLQKTIVSPGDTIKYNITVRNERDEPTDLSNTIYILSSPKIFDMPYKLIFSYVNLSYPKINLGPKQSTQFEITLVYDKPNKLSNLSFDVDSIIYFMQQYKPKNLTIIGQTPQELDNLLITAPELGAGLSLNQIKRINIQDYLAYWSSYKQVVYVEDNYELALLASTYASLINAPLIIKGTKLDKEEVFSGKDVICIGNVAPAGNSCKEQANMRELQQKYVDITKTRKMILTANDLGINAIEQFKPTKSLNTLSSLYSRNSLISPILASAKQELILITNKTNYTDIGNDVSTNYLNLIRINMSKYYCNARDSCSENFIKQLVSVKGLENQSIFNMFVTDDGSTEVNSNYSFTFYGFFVDCGADTTTLKIYLNNTLVRTINATCGSFEYGTWRGWDTYFSYFATGIISYPNIKNESLNVRLEYSGKLISYDHPSFPLVFMAKNLQLTSCKNFSQSCAPTPTIYNFSVQYANDTSYLNFYNVNTNWDYNLEINGSSENLNNLSVYVNDNYIGNITCRGYYYKLCDGVIKIPNNLISNTMRIKLVPGSSGILVYDIKAQLSPKFLDYYLTIMSSAHKIPISKFIGGPPGRDMWLALDSYYADFNNDHFPDVGVGRVTGLSSSDVSSYVARDLFQDLFSKTNKVTFLASSFDNMIDNANKWSQEFRSAGYDVVNVTNPQPNYDFDPELWKNNDFVDYGDHGGPHWAGVDSEKIPWLNNSYVSTNACLTCAMYPAWDSTIGTDGNYFCTSAIRKGALGYVGAVNIDWDGETRANMINEIFYYNKTLGQAYSKGFVYENGQYQTTLIGDPTLNLNPTHLLNNPITYRKI